MTLPIKCKHCDEIIFIEESLSGLEDSLDLNLCEDCDDEDCSD
jgi:hypothetical protein